MDSSESIHTRSIWTGSRPVRAVWIVPSTISFESLSELTQRACAYWGGWFYLLVPITESGEVPVQFENIVRDYDPDVVATVGFKPTKEMKAHLRRLCNPFQNNICMLDNSPYWATCVGDLAWPGNLQYLLDTRYPADPTFELILMTLFGAYSEE